jgi:hypothetical protein
LSSEEGFSSFVVIFISSVMFHAKEIEDSG